ncbi:MAG: cobalamin-binding protein, partial [Deltaproteobacteria bacterium]|nr:cobalamin-binding protein [Deltaproteobacteria bacterium]
MTIQDAYQAVLTFDAAKVTEIVKAEIEAGTDSSSILD